MGHLVTESIMIKSNIKAFLLLSLCTTIFSGCQQEGITQSGEETLTAYIEGTGTKTSYDSIEGKFIWSAGDQIAIHFTTTGFATYDVNPENGAVSVSSSVANQRDYYAIYPASAAVADNYGNPSLSVTLPSEYDISDIIAGAEGNPGADYSPVPMVALNDPSSAPNNLDFYHVGGLLRITLSGIKAATQKVRVTFDKDVTGEYAVTDPGTTAPYITTEGTDENNVVTFTLAETAIGETLAAGIIVLNVPVPCGTYESVKVECLDNTDSVIASELFDDKDLIFERHHGKKLAFGNLVFDYVLGTIRGTQFSYHGGIATFSNNFVSYKTSDGGETKIPVSFTIEFDEYGFGLPNWSTTPPSWITHNNSQDGSIDGQILSLSVSRQEQRDLDRDNNHIELLNNGYYNSAEDLSTHNVATGATNIDRTTANCYVVDRPGLYKFPLVYGNGVLNGSINEDAYHARNGVNGEYRPDEGEDGYLGRFKDHLDNYITSPYIAIQHSGKTLTAELLWSDIPELITDVHLGGSGEDCYLYFEAPSETITQGNALVAVMVNGQIAWSWHIWVTNEDMKAIEGPGGYYFAPVNLGWKEKTHWKYPSRQYWVRVKQSESGKVTSIASIYQLEGNPLMYDSCPYYQWGRKDPISESYIYRSASNYIGLFIPTSEAYKSVLGASGPVTIGNAIQTPYIHYNTDWTSATYYNSWNSTNNVYGDAQLATTHITKTIYDPSPVGYKVPPQAALGAFSDFSSIIASSPDETNESRMYSGFKYNPTGLIFPCADRRRAADGQILEMGWDGYYWSATPYNTDTSYSMALWDIGNSWSPTGRYNNADANTVRPVLDDIDD